MTKVDSISGRSDSTNSWSGLVHSRCRLSLLVATCLCIGCNVKSRSYSYSSSGGQSRSIVTRGSGESQTIVAKLGDGNSTFELQSQGAITLSENEQDVVDIQPHGYLRFSDDDGTTVRKMDWERAENGDLKRSYSVDGSSADLDAEGEAWLAQSFDRMLHETPIGAVSRANRLLKEGGPDALLAEIGKLKNDNLQETYLRVLASAEGIQSGTMVQAVKLVATQISSPSAQEDALIELSSHFRDDADISLALIDAATNIKSPSHQEDVLVALSKNRELTSAVTIAAIRAAGEIDSPSHQVDVLTAILSKATPDTDIQTAYIEVADTVSSPSHQEDVFLALIESGISDPAVFKRVAAAAAKIRSVSSQEDVMVKLIRAAPADDDVLIACLDVVPNIKSSSHQEDVMKEVLKRDNLSEPVLRRAAQVVKKISSSHSREELQAKILDQMTD